MEGWEERNSIITVSVLLLAGVCLADFLCRNNTATNCDKQSFMNPSFNR